MTDVTIANHGAIVLIQPLTEAAEAWIAEHIPEDAQTWGTAIVAEPRYVGAIIEGMTEDGLAVG